VFILSYNNEPQNRYKANLDSVFQQNYENYFVVYVNDVSSDRTGELVQEYMDQNPIAK
jgi:cellulose synthase/poly-beta-1,6-N-acetylglucosamine synthase-like glycosyltransferase